MSTSAQRGHFALAVQASEVGSGTFDATTLTWRRMRTTALDFAVQDLIDQMPPELGGGLFSSGLYKNGAFMSGGAGMEVRLKGSLGHLLYAVTGDYTSVAAVPSTTPKKNVFQVDPTNDAALPIAAMRKYTPDKTGSAGITEYGYDGRIGALRLVIPQMGTMKAEVSMIGARVQELDSEDSTGDAIEDAETVALSCKAAIELTDLASYLPGNLATGGKYTGAEIVINNQFTNPTDEMILGSYHPELSTPLMRTAAINLVYKWDDAELYQQMVYGPPSSSKRAWKPNIVSSAVKITAKSAGIVPTFGTHPYQLEFEAPAVDWSMSPVVLAPGRMVMVQLTGLIKQAAGGTPSYKFNLFNDATYTY
jgi:hypothetical protein